MAVRSFLLVFVYTVCIVAKGQTSRKYNAINPTGTYRTHFNNPKGNIFPQGIIKVKRLGQNRIVVSLMMQNGEPLLRSGWFMDTLLYKNHSALFTNAEIDTTCRIALHFYSKGIQVKQESRFIRDVCGFADGVSANGFYFKESAGSPDFRNPY